MVYWFKNFVKQHAIEQQSIAVLPLNRKSSIIRNRSGSRTTNNKSEPVYNQLEPVTTSFQEHSTNFIMH